MCCVHHAYIPVPVFYHMHICMHAMQCSVANSAVKGHDLASMKRVNNKGEYSIGHAGSTRMMLHYCCGACAFTTFCWSMHEA